jgi:serine/threonine protein kinase
VQTLVARSSYDLQRIDREAAISQKLRGKANIITIDRTPRYHVVGQEGDYISLYTKWSSKGSVSQWLESSPPLMERAKVALGVVRGMQHMESAQVAHHDIKTDNILLNDYLVPAWTDFGESDHVDRYPQYVRGYIKNRSPEKVAAAVLPAFVKEAGFPELSEQLSTGKISLTEARSFLKKYEAVPISEDKSESLERALKIIDQLKEYKTDVFALGLVLHEIFHFDPKRGTSSANQHPVVKDVKLPRFVELQLENHEKEATVNVTKTLFRYPGREEKLEEPLKNPSSRLLHQVDLLIRRMLDQNPQNRPSQKEVYESLKKIFE